MQLAWPGIFKLKNYRNLYLAGALSEFGSFVTESALIMHLYKISGGEKAVLGMYHASFLIFLILGNLLGGPYAEKRNRKKILIIAELGRIPAIATLLFVNDFYSVIICTGVVAFFTGVFNPARQAMVNDLVPQEKMSQANSAFATCMAVIHMLAPVFGVMVYEHFSRPTEVLIFDLLTYVIGIGLLLQVNYVKPQEFRAKNFVKDLTQGVSFIFKRGDLSALHFNRAITGLCLGLLIPLLLPFTTTVLNRPEHYYAYIMYAFGLGGLIGGPLGRKLQISPGKMAMSIVFLEALAMLVWVNTHIFHLNLVVLFMWGVLVFMKIPSNLNYVSERVETEYMTRVHASLELSYVIPNISGGLILWFIGNQFDTYTILNTTAIVFLTVMILRIPTKGLWELFYEKHPKVQRKLQEANTH